MLMKNMLIAIGFCYTFILFPPFLIFLILWPMCGFTFTGEEIEGGFEGGDPQGLL